jgi:EAL domain-containing protein (putative c-di-GMP-specific phosphodiesterase class I)
LLKKYRLFIPKLSTLFSPNGLKIDRSFVSQMNLDDKNAKIVQAIITLAQAMDIEIVAEGIETVPQQAQMTALHCQYGQGYLFSVPLTAQAATTFISGQLNHVERCSNY